MKILVLDDNDARLKAFKKHLIGHILDCVKTAKEAIQKISETKYDAIFLDHDLGDRILEPSGYGTGFEVAQWLNEHSEKIPQITIIHSFNVYGARNMMSYYLIPNTNPEYG